MEHGAPVEQRRPGCPHHIKHPGASSTLSLPHVEDSHLLDPAPPASMCADFSWHQLCRATQSSLSHSTVLSTTTHACVLVYIGQGTLPRSAHQCTTCTESSTAS